MLNILTFVSQWEMRGTGTRVKNSNLIGIGDPIINTLGLKRMKVSHYFPKEPFSQISEIFKG